MNNSAAESGDHSGSAHTHTATKTDGASLTASGGGAGDLSFLGGELSSELKASADFWREFDLENKRQELKKQCMEMIDAKTASSNGKKRLNEITKAFRAKSPVNYHCLTILIS